MKSTNLTKGFQSMNVTNAVSNDSQHGLRQSESITEVAKALLAFQTEMPTVVKDAKNPFFKCKYATLANIWHACQPVLAKHGLVVNQSSGEAYKVGNDTFNDFHTRIIHAESGQWIEAVSAIPAGKADPQGYGSTNTYSRRYCLAPLIGIVVDEDDDGNAANGRDNTKQAAPKQPPKSPKKTYQENPNKRLRHFFNQAGCQTADDMNQILNYVMPGETSESVKTDTRAQKVLDEINRAIKAKEFTVQSILNLSDPAMQAADAFPKE